MERKRILFFQKGVLESLDKRRGKLKRLFYVQGFYLLRLFEKGLGFDRVLLMTTYNDIS